MVNLREYETRCKHSKLRVENGILLARWIWIGAILVTSYMLGYGTAKYVKVNATKVVFEKPMCIVIDPGHGAMDPGKVGRNGTLEKDINLAIAKKLRMFLQQQGFLVYLTREDDAPLYDSSSENKKQQDMRKRIKIMDDCHADIVISIHQNSYEKSDVRGAQSFFYKDSDEGKLLAESIQKQLLELDATNHRTIKQNSDYYLLKKAKQPIVIVECGFLSNPEEERQLVDELYQEKVAWKIQMGILNYLSAKEL